MSQYYGPIARARGDRERMQRKKAREAERKRRRKAWLASPAGKEHLARKARREERWKRCCVCGAPTPQGEARLENARQLVSRKCCSPECEAVHWLYLDELEQAKRAGMPVAQWRREPGVADHTDYLNRKAGRVAIAQRESGGTST